MKPTRAAPLRFLVAVVLLWTAARGAMLFGWQPPAVADGAKAPAVALARLFGVAPASAAMPPLVHLELPAVAEPSAPAEWQPAASSVTIALDDAPPEPDAPHAAPVRLALASTQAPNGATYRRADGVVQVESVGLSPQTSPSRWSGSAWAFVRGGGRATALSPGGQIGGGQGGARVLYRIGSGVSATARVSRTIGGIHQAEAAVGLD